MSRIGELPNVKLSTHARRRRDATTRSTTLVGGGARSCTSVASAGKLARNLCFTSGGTVAMVDVRHLRQKTNEGLAWVLVFPQCL